MSENFRGGWLTLYVSLYSTYKNSQENKTVNQKICPFELFYTMSYENVPLLFLQ